MALDHHAAQGVLAGQALIDHVVQHGRLAQRVLAAVGVAAIDHDARRDAELFQPLAGRLHAGGIMVRALVAAA
ncbi:hypothetical protein D3C80_1992950 [compost metagenome]